PAPGCDGLARRRRRWRGARFRGCASVALEHAAVVITVTPAIAPGEVVAVGCQDHVEPPPVRDGVPAPGELHPSAFHTSPVDGGAELTVVVFVVPVGAGALVIHVDSHQSVGAPPLTLVGATDRYGRGRRGGTRR